VQGKLLEYPRIAGVQGRGAFRAYSLRHDAEDTAGEFSSAEILALVERIRRLGVIVHPGPSAIQLIPAAVSAPGDLDRAADAILDALREADAA
jgi:adenosylmethionine-8-amino-7-oxononanoate aminotransferase